MPVSLQDGKVKSEITSPTSSTTHSQSKNCSNKNNKKHETEIDNDNVLGEQKIRNTGKSLKINLNNHESRR